MNGYDLEEIIFYNYISEPSLETLLEKYGIKDYWIGSDEYSEDNNYYVEWVSDNQERDSSGDHLKIYKRRGFML
jgi:hypothetical protein